MTYRVCPSSEEFKFHASWPHIKVSGTHIGPRCVHLSVRFMWTGDLRTPCGYFFFTNLQQTSKQTQGWTDAIYNGQRFKVTVTSHKKKTKKTFLRSVKSLRSAKTLFWCRNAPKEVKTVLYTEFVPSLKLRINLATDLWSWTLESVLQLLIKVPLFV